jgi:hypothetical protein
MGMHEQTQKIIQTAYDMLAALNPPGATTTKMTVRQIFYQLLTPKIIDNNKGGYQKVSNALVKARQDGTIPWHWIEDRIRRPRIVPMWSGLSDFAETAISAYRRNVWENQKKLVEVWVEKDALSGIFEDVLEQYGVTLNIGRGYDGWSSIYGAAQRYKRWNDVVILYFGDFDPSGVDMARSLEERLKFFKTKVQKFKL